MPKALQPLQLMFIYERNMLIDVKLIVSRLHKNDHMQDTKHKNTKEGHCEH
jgi:hypothetical protein